MMCDYEQPEFFVQDRVRARKPHRCGECGGRIYVGEHYSRVTGKWDGVVKTHKTCDRCEDVVDWLYRHDPDYCRLFGGLYEDEALRDYMRTKRFFQLRRLLVAVRRRVRA